MSKGALSLVLLFGTVNAACGRSGQPAVGPAPLTATGDSAGPDSTGRAAASGAPVQVWRAKAGRRLTGRVVVADSTIYGAGADRQVYAVDLATGQRRWSSRLGGMVPGGVLVVGDTVIAATSRPDGRVTALSGSTGHRIWRVRTGPVGAPLSLIDGTLIAQTQRGDVVGLDPGTGRIRWRRKLGPARAAAVPSDSGTMIVATVDSLFRLTAKDGRIAVKARSPGAVVSPWIEQSGVLVAGTTDSLVVGVDRRTLVARWQVRLDAPVLSSPAASGDTLFAASRRGTLYRIVGDSARVAERVVELDWPVTAPVAALDGLVLLGGADGTLRALYPDGREAWRLQLRWPIELGPQAVEDGLLAIGGDGDIHRYRR
jgi:outer membrane protein assembly factor BamB